MEDSEIELVYKKMYGFTEVEIYLSSRATTVELKDNLIKVLKPLEEVGKLHY